MLISKKTIKIARFLCLVSIVWFSVGEFAQADRWVGGSGSAIPISETSWNDPSNWFSTSGPTGGVVPIPFADIEFRATDVTNFTVHLDPQIGSRRQVGQLQFEVGQSMLSRNSASQLEISGGINANSNLGDITIGGSGVEAVDIELSGGLPLSGDPSSQTWSNTGTSNLIVKNNITTLESTGTTTLTFAGNGAGEIQIEGVISDGATAALALTFTDDNTVVLAGENTFTGGSTISGGVVELKKVGSLGTGTVELEAGVVQIADTLNIANNFVISDTGNSKILGLDAAATSGGFSGDIVINEMTAGNFVVAADSGATLTLSGELSGQRVSIEDGGNRSSHKRF